ncbi:MAG: hypothetical protein WKF96_08825 [Solirubrobacteraceae bacterium]
MSTIDELYRRYIDEYRTAGDADPRTYLAELRGVDRAELAARIDHFLDSEPPPAFDAAAFAAFREDPRRQALVTRILGSETLADLRATAAASKREVGEALAERLGLAGHAAAVRARYHDVETGTVDPGRVTGRVWDALAAILGAPAERLREAAERAFGGPSGQTDGVAFARSQPTGRARRHEKAQPPEGDADDDIVDRAFFEH